MEIGVYGLQLPMQCGYGGRVEGGNGKGDDGSEHYGSSQVRLSELASSSWHVVHDNVVTGIGMGTDAHASQINQDLESTPRALNTLANAEKVEKKKKGVQQQHSS